MPMNNDHVDPRGRKRGNSRNGSGSFSHGPMFGYSFGVSAGGSSPIENNANIVGPRLNNTMRRTSGTSNGSRTPGDEASSVAVSLVFTFRFNRRRLMAFTPSLNVRVVPHTPHLLTSPYKTAKSVIYVFVLPYHLFTAPTPTAPRLGRRS
jgi:hypothetical protein